MTQPVVDITLQSLKGFSFVDDKQTSDLKIPTVTAVVGFGGSARNMQVGTSIVCPRTGNLMVESRVACTTPRSSPNRQPLVARWNHASEGAEVLSLEIDEEQQPHLSVSLCEQDPRLPAMPVSESNRDSNILQNISNGLPSMDLSETSSHSEQRESSPVDQGGSIIWSQSAAMPEIIELNINLRVETDYQNNRVVQREVNTLQESPSLLDSETRDEECSQESLDSIYEIGVAYLVLFGNDGGTTLMDLPLKKLRRKTINNIAVEPNASIRIRVDVYSTGKKKIAGPTHKYLKPMPESYQIHEPNMLEPILRQLKLAEDMRREKTRSKCDTKRRRVRDRNKVFCGFVDMFISNCDDHEEGMDLGCASAMDSTIDTTPS
eukprot:CAMPEP_0194256330 /NCGR_PEP_ID=MMETSP0158-20130606/36445_1 /TAXON_ID=33649 /ORGANISM="Thalassionema nitzschioides, Strain L26-B" /LENGTH=376 /DNA_ID=CAMNT_0038994977 /DNA_START=166 /DNA_END=1292 /DNA_ORIENTATION=-